MNILSRKTTNVPTNVQEVVQSTEINKLTESMIDIANKEQQSINILSNVETRIDDVNARIDLLQNEQEHQSRRRYTKKIENIKEFRLKYERYKQFVFNNGKRPMFNKKNPMETRLYNWLNHNKHLLDKYESRDKYRDRIQYVDACIKQQWI